MAREKILVVEDEENILEAIKYSLTSEGFDVYGAEDGEKGLEMARELAPDLVVLDEMLPKIDGFEVCRMLRKDMDLPVFMLSAKAEEIDRVVGLEIGADDYITKPFSMRELVVRVRNSLRRRSLTASENTSTKNSGSLRVASSGLNSTLSVAILALSTAATAIAFTSFGSICNLCFMCRSLVEMKV